jgi:hypothetical protein
MGPATLNAWRRFGEPDLDPQGAQFVGQTVIASLAEVGAKPAACRALAEDDLLVLDLDAPDMARVHLGEEFRSRQLRQGFRSEMVCCHAGNHGGDERQQLSEECPDIHALRRHTDRRLGEHFVEGGAQGDVDFGHRGGDAETRQRGDAVA